MGIGQHRKIFPAFFNQNKGKTLLSFMFDRICVECYMIASWKFPGKPQLLQMDGQLDFIIGMIITEHDARSVMVPHRNREATDHFLVKSSSVLSA